MTKQKLINVCVSHVNNPALVQDFSKGKDIDSSIRKHFAEAIGVENPTPRDLRLNEPIIYEILSEVLTETYLKSVNEDEFFMQFAEIKNLALGDTQEFYIEDTGTLYVSEHSGNHWNITKQKLEGGTYKRIEVKSFAIGVYGDFELFMSGRLSFAKLIEKVGQALQTKVYQEVAAGFAAASTNLPPAFKKSGAYDKAELNDLISKVEAISGSVPIVLGTRKGLSKVTDGMNMANFTDGMKADYHKTGRIIYADGIYFAYLPAVFKPNTFDFAYDDDQLLVLPSNDDKFIKLVFEGESRIRQVNDNTSNMDMTFEHKLISRFGSAVIFGSAFGQYKFI